MRTVENSKQTPARRREVAREAGKARHSLDTYIASIVRRAPELTDDQKATLRTIFAEPDPTGSRTGAA